MVIGSFYLAFGSFVKAGNLCKMMFPIISVAVKSIIPCMVFQKATSVMYAPKPIKPNVVTLEK